MASAPATDSTGVDRADDLPMPPAAEAAEAQAQAALEQGQQTAQLAAEAVEDAGQPGEPSEAPPGEPVDEEQVRLHPELAGCTEFTLDELYKLAVKFYRDHENKAFHPTYDQRNQFYALHLQSRHGAFLEEKAAQLGALDFVGKDRRLVWRELGEMGREEAMLRFLNQLHMLCESFRPFVEAHQRERQERQRVQREEQQQLQHLASVEQQQQEAEDEQRRLQEEERYRKEQQKREFKEALNRQTHEQFEAYAVQQYPTDPAQQQQLIQQLQEQHFLQYVQQMMQTQPDPRQISYELRKEEPPAQPLDQSTQSNHSNHSNQSNQLDRSAEERMRSLQLNGESGARLNHDGGRQEMADSGRHRDEEDEQEEEGDEEYEQDEEGEENEIENVDDENEQHGDFELQIAAPQIWTKKIIKSFKESIAKDSGDGVIKIGHGEVLTVRVPTHSNGSCLVWEFATDSYDIGFGLLFEWNQNPGEQVTVHISESEEEDEEDDDDDEDDEDGDAKSGRSRKRRHVIDPEQGALTRSGGGRPRIEPASSSADGEVGRTNGQSTRLDSMNSEDSSGDNELPVSVIIPIYRRDCHEEVYAGSHQYPGRGAYLLKFDNTYSLWRAKTLYYRVYYTN